jgi:hypothetical protein
VYVPPQQTNTNNNTNNNNNSNRNTNNIYINGIPYSQYQAQAQTFYQPTYSYGYEYPQYHYYAGPLSVTCSADTTYTTVGNTLRWRAFVTGGYGNPIISWTGTDGLTGYGQTVAKSYAYPGQKGATVTVTSGGQVTSAYCAPVTIGGPVVYQPPYQAPLPPAYPPAQSGLDIACYATPTKIKVGQTVTWTADARGGAAPFRYSWTGTDGLVSTQRSVSKTYYSAGTKKATVTVTSADGRSTTRNCGVTVSVTSAVAATSVKGGKEGSSVAQAPVYTPPQYQGPQYYDPLTGQPLPPGVQPFPVNEQPTSTQSASLFSIKNISWGWVSFLVILVLFVTVIYLIFNKNKV